MNRRFGLKQLLVLPIVLSAVLSTAFAGESKESSPKWQDLSGRQYELVKGNEANCAGGLLTVETHGGKQSITFGPLLHFEIESRPIVKEKLVPGDCRSVKETSGTGSQIRVRKTETHCSKGAVRENVTETFSILKSGDLEYVVTENGQVSRCLFREEKAQIQR